MGSECIGSPKSEDVRLSSDWQIRSDPATAILCRKREKPQKGDIVGREVEMDVLVKAAGVVSG